MQYPDEYQRFLQAVNGPVPEAAFDQAMDILVARNQENKSLSEKACRMKAVEQLTLTYASAQPLKWEEFAGVSCSLDPSTLFVMALKAFHKDIQQPYKMKPFEFRLRFETLALDSGHASWQASHISWLAKEHMQVICFEMDMPKELPKM